MTRIELMEQVATRLKGLRDALSLSTAQIAHVLNINEQLYLSYENGTSDIPLGLLQQVANLFNVELNVLLFGEEPKMDSYYVTRAGAGIKVERTVAYSYQSLAAGFKNRNFEPLVVTVEPNDNPVTLNSHDGQEWNYVIEGRMELHIGDKTIILNTGDSVMYDSNRPHGMKALDNKELKFITIIS